MARRDRPCGAVDRARLYRVLPDPAPLGSDQRDAGDAVDSGDGVAARISRARREDITEGDRGRAGDRQRAVVDRWTRAELAAAIDHSRSDLAFHSANQPVKRPLSRSPPCQAAVTPPSLATISTTSSPLERRSVSIA